VIRDPGYAEKVRDETGKERFTVIVLRIASNKMLPKE
jgi:hypothetical protein